MFNEKQGKQQQLFIDKGVEYFKTHNVGCFNLAMRIGKTRVTIEMLKKLFPKDGSVLIAYPDNKLKDSWISECEKWNYKNPNLRLVNFSSLIKYTTMEFSAFIIDEFPMASENEQNLCNLIIKNSIKTIQLSGTITPETKYKWGIQEVVNYSTDKGIADGILADYKITVHFVNLDNKVLIENSRGIAKTEKKQYDSYTWVIDKLKQEGKSTMFIALARNRLSLNSLAKNRFVKNLLNTLQDKRVLIFTGQTKAADNLGIPSYHSKSKDNSLFTSYLNEKFNHLALSGIGKAGVTYPKLDCVILSNFTYNSEESSQILNRAINLDYKGKIADLRIICLNEPAEIKKIKVSLSLLNQDKITYIYV